MIQGAASLHHMIRVIQDRAALHHMVQVQQYTHHESIFYEYEYILRVLVNSSANILGSSCPLHHYWVFKEEVEDEERPR